MKLESTLDHRPAFLHLAPVLDVMALEGTIWLAPYDLGVRQNIRLTIEDTGEEDVYAIKLLLTRGSGQQRSWWKLNKTFISDLRRQLLGWRKLRPERAMEYITEGDKLLETQLG